MDCAKEKTSGNANITSAGGLPDDDALILLNTCTLLEDMGHHVLQAGSGKAALDALEAEEVDLLITDFAMPNMTGAELVIDGGVTAQ